ncbi:hypothetical protein QG37_07972 [Candidozyma auris]|uniref:Uncharacterized protein n=1 Tax=Candidozyma auris TaxID=498019 RepID=A0A0L0NND6_CANAR|nr:hypothetical protein QG37_07972 [[Candida] auris]
MHDPGHFAAIKDRFKVVKFEKGAILFQISMSGLSFFVVT